MKSLASWLIVMFMAMFWMFRVALTLAVQYDRNEIVLQLMFLHNNFWNLVVWLLDIFGKLL